MDFGGDQRLVGGRQRQLVFRRIFELLLKINGIGSSLALAVLSNFSYNKIIEIISKNDYTTLRQVPKLGEKKAQIITKDCR